MIVLANPEEVKNRKGHKTDRKDAEHLADLLRHNHIRSSYIPPKPVRDLRDLTRGAERGAVHDDLAFALACWRTRLGSVGLVGSGRVV